MTRYTVRVTTENGSFVIQGVEAYAPKVALESVCQQLNLSDRQLTSIHVDEQED